MPLSQVLHVLLTTLFEGGGESGGGGGDPDWGGYGGAGGGGGSGVEAAAPPPALGILPPLPAPPRAGVGLAARAAGVRGTLAWLLSAFGPAASGLGIDGVKLAAAAAASRARQQAAQQTAAAAPRTESRDCHSPGASSASYGVSPGSGLEWERGSDDDELPDGVGISVGGATSDGGSAASGGPAVATADECEAAALDSLAASVVGGDPGPTCAVVWALAQAHAAYVGEREREREREQKTRASRKKETLTHTGILQTVSVILVPHLSMLTK